MQENQCITVSGKRFTRKQVNEVRETVEMFQNLSRKELAYTICENLKWVTPKGELKINSGIVALERFEKLGIITLPKKVVVSPYQIRRPTASAATAALEPMTEPLSNLLPIELRRVTTKMDRELWNEYMDRYHYLGYKRPFGAYLRYFIVSKNKDDLPLGCLLFSASAWALAPRDLWIGWRTQDKFKRLNLIVNNNRFLIFPWVQVDNLASHVLSKAAKSITHDWEEAYGYRPVLLETFVDPSQFDGTCYRAANWQLLGDTQGQIRVSKNRLFRSTPSAKKIYVLPLVPNFRDILQGKVSSKKIRPTVFMNQTYNQSDISNVVAEDPQISVWQKITQALSSVCSKFDEKWQKRQRLIDTLMLVVIIFRLVLSKNSQGYATTLSELWKNQTLLKMRLPQPRPICPSALTQARQKLDESLFKDMNQRFIEIYETENVVNPMDPFENPHLWYGHRIFAVDGSKMNVPRTLIEVGYKVPSSGHYPQGLASVLYHLKAKVPYDFDLAKHGNERVMALEHLKTLYNSGNKDNLIVYDRGYFSYSMLYKHITHEVAAVFRLPRAGFHEIRSFMDGEQSDIVVRIQPKRKKVQSTLCKQLGLQSIEPLSLRLIRYHHDNTIFYIGTTLLDQGKYPAEIFPEIYHGRWGIEELYKISKSLIEIEDFHSQSERGVRQELFAHFVIITLTRMLANNAESTLNSVPILSKLSPAAQKQPSKSNSLMRVNFKNSLALVEHHLEELIFGTSHQITGAIHAILEGIARVKYKWRGNRKYLRISLKPIKKWRPKTKSNQQSLVPVPVPM